MLDCRLPGDGGYGEAGMVLPEGSSSRDLRLVRNTKPRTMRPIAAIPPTTPPAIAPAWDEEEDESVAAAATGVCVGVIVVVVVEVEVEVIEEEEDEEALELEDEEEVMMACGEK